MRTLLFRVPGLVSVNGGERANAGLSMLVLRDQPTGSGATCRKILDALPAWFGIPEANDDYVAFAETAPSVVASIDGRDVGLLTLQLHSPYAAEVHLIAVLPEHHRFGIGRTMLHHAERRLAKSGVEFLQVKTLSEKRPDPNYDKTREFYLAQGFRPLEEFSTLWDPSNPALQLIKSLSPADDAEVDAASAKTSHPPVFGSDAGRVAIRGDFDSPLPAEVASPLGSEGAPE